ncbi:glycosyl hydrolase 108 family protein, partial [Yersinia enterocolitica]
MTKSDIFDAILGKEGGYVNHPDDKGGPTRWGITQKVARAHGYMGDMRNLPRETALSILEADYWTGPRFDQIRLFVQALSDAKKIASVKTIKGGSQQGSWGL